MKKLLGLLFALCLAFVLNASYANELAPDTPMFKVNEKTITKADYDKMFRYHMNHADSDVQVALMGKNTIEEGDLPFTLIKYKTVNTLVKDALMDEDYKKYNIVVTDEEVEKEWKEKRGNYPQGVYDEFLQMHNLTVEEHKNIIRDDIKLEQLGHAVYVSEVPEAQLKELYKIERKDNDITYENFKKDYLETRKNFGEYRVLKDHIEQRTKMQILFITINPATLKN